jgi:hypothetical protein
MNVDHDRYHSMTYKWELHKPCHEKSQKLLRGDVRTGRERVLKIVPGAPEDATQHNGEDIACIKRLNAVPDDTDHGSNEDEEVGAVHAHDGTYKHRAACC